MILQNLKSESSWNESKACHLISREDEISFADNLMEIGMAKLVAMLEQRVPEVGNHDTVYNHNTSKSNINKRSFG